jgi:hypothetical protein
MHREILQGYYSTKNLKQKQSKNFSNYMNKSSQIKLLEIQEMLTTLYFPSLCQKSFKTILLSLMQSILLLIITLPPTISCLKESEQCQNTAMKTSYTALSQDKVNKWHLFLLGKIVQWSQENLRYFNIGQRISHLSSVLLILLTLDKIHKILRAWKILK